MAMEQDVVRIGWQFSKGLIDTLGTFIKSFNEMRGTNADRSAKEFQKKLEGKRFTQRDKFVAQSMHKAKSIDFEQIKINNRDIKYFDKLCKSYGLDYLYEKKPKLDINKVINTPEGKRNSFEQSIIKNWTEKGLDGKLIETPDDAKITFRIKDISKLEFVVEDLAKKKHTLEQRKELAKSIMKKSKTKSRTKTKEKASEEISMVQAKPKAKRKVKVKEIQK